MLGAGDARPARGRPAHARLGRRAVPRRPLLRRPLAAGRGRRAREHRGLAAVLARRRKSILAKVFFSW